MEWTDGLLSATIRNYVYLNTARDAKKNNVRGLKPRISDLSNVSLTWNDYFYFDNSGLFHYLFKDRLASLNTSVKVNLKIISYKNKPENKTIVF